MAMLSKVPLMLTLLDLSSGVVYQNEASVFYWGTLQQAVTRSAGPMLKGGQQDEGYRPTAAFAVLQHLAHEEPQLVRDMLQSVQQGTTWKRVSRAHTWTGWAVSGVNGLGCLRHATSGPGQHMAVAVS